MTLIYINAFFLEQSIVHRVRHSNLPEPIRANTSEIRCLRTNLADSNRSVTVVQLCITTMVDFTALNRSFIELASGGAGDVGGSEGIVYRRESISTCQITPSEKALLVDNIRW